MFIDNENKIRLSNMVSSLLASLMGKLFWPNPVPLEQIQFKTEKTKRKNVNEPVKKSHSY